jgi:O-antigen ligase/transposase-like protein
MHRARLSLDVAVGLPVVGVLVGGVLIGGMMLVLAPLWGVLLVVGAGLVLVMLKRPELGLLAILVLISSIIFESELPLIPLPVGSLHIPDIILLGLLGLIVVRRLVEPDFRLVRTPLDLPLLAFYGVTLLCTVLAVSRTPLAFEAARRSLRIVSYYLVFFVVTNLIRDRQQVMVLVQGVFLVAMLVAGVMLVQFSLGTSVAILPGRVETMGIQGEGSYTGIARILPPGQSILLVSFMSTVTLLVLGRLRPVTLFRLVQIVLLGVGLVLTFQRNFWIMVLLGWVLALGVARGAERRRMIGWFSGAGLVVLVLVLVLGFYPESQPAQVVGAAGDRFRTLVGEQVITDPSLRQRDVEYEYALPQIAAHPLTGLGAGARYRPFDPRIDWRGGFDGRAYIHNGHLWIMLQSGLIGYGCLVWVSLLFMTRGLRAWRRIPDPDLRGLVLGFTLVTLTGLAGNITSPMFMQWFWVPVYGLMFGANEVIIRLTLPHEVQEPRATPWLRVADRYLQRGPAQPAVPRCPVCQVAIDQEPAGTNPSGSQRYRCTRCAREYTPFPRRQSYSGAFKRRVVRRVLAGQRPEDVARDLNLSPSSVTRWVDRYAPLVRGERPAP